jgi:hypothetical protein
MLAEYRAFENKVGPHIHAQHLNHLEVSRSNCPYVLLTVLYNPEDGFPSGRGGSMNGGFNTRRGTVLMSSHDFTKRPNAQSTIQHEPGHAFGLPHVDAYGYSLKGDNPSIVAYNPKHHTYRFRPSSQPGTLIPEDIRGLALNDRVFPNLEFDPEKHIPQGYEISPTIKSNSAGSYPRASDYKIEVTTDARAVSGTNIQNTINVRIDPSPGPKISSDRRSMSHSETVDGEAHVDLKFPFLVELLAMWIYSGHSGSYHPAMLASVLVPRDGSSYREVGNRKFRERDGHVTFDMTEARFCQVALTPSTSRKITFRGIRFYSGDTEIFRLAICPVKS